MKSTEMISLLFASMFLPFVIPKNGESATVGSKIWIPTSLRKLPFIHVLRPDPDFVGPTVFFPTKPSSTFMGSFVVYHVHPAAANQQSSTSQGWGHCGADGCAMAFQVRSRFYHLLMLEIWWFSKPPLMAHFRIVWNPS